jgi:hypothetical protein
MPIDYSRYPKDWKTVIRPRILERARNCCEDCGLPNHSIVLSRSRTLLCDPQPYREAQQALGFYHEPDDKAIVIVLTIAHLDHDISNNADTNLRALCQRCHLTHDTEHHAQNARQTRDQKTGQLALLI